MANVINYLPVSITDVYQRVGVIEHTHTSSPLDMRPKRPFDAKQYGVLVFWPRAISSWFSLRLQHGDPAQDFKDSPEAIDEVCRTVGVKPDDVASASFKQNNNYQVACVGRDAKITLTVRIDTDHEGFRQAVLDQEGAEQRKEFLQNVEVMFFDAKLLGTYFNQQGVISISVKPANPVPAFDGFAALDLGNTSSTLVALSLSNAFYKTDAIQIVNADAPRGDLKQHIDPVVSNVRIDLIRSYEPQPPGVRVFPSVPKDDYPQTVNWVAGRVASPQDGSASGTEPATQGLVLGSKRLAAGKDWEKTQKLVARHRRTYEKTEQSEQVEILHRLPAELLICRLLQRFREATYCWPRSLAITYPTTYSPRELEQLREIVQRAWLRMQVRLQSVPQGVEEPAAEHDPELDRSGRALQQLIHSHRLGMEPGEDPVLHLMVDEASAAAFFFLYRRIFEEPGGLPRFRYLYPRGLNMLLYDCGGGTTDIALVQASFDPEAVDVLRIKVLARSGLRGFGGDEITRTVCRIFKAKLAQKVAEARGRPLKINWPAPPAASSAGERNRLSQHARAVEDALLRLKELDPRDEFVPTTFNVHQMDDTTNQRRDHALNLWRWGEMLKMKLGRSDSAPFLRIDRNMKGLAETLLKGLSDAQAQQLATQIEKITISRWEVDALIEAQVLKSVKNCNNLIRDHLALGQPDDAEQEVHWVVVSGNASQYPLIQELLRRELHVPFINEDRFTLDEKNLKHAVAKGAVLALSTIRAIGTVQIEFDSDLSNCLPFDIAYKDLRNNTYPILYREHLRYDKLEKKKVSIISDHSQASPQRKLEKFVLERRFPGDESFAPFLAFHFPDGIHGDLEVAYDPEQREFSVRDVTTNAFGELKDVTDNSIYRSPAQRGDL
ncbi:MAG TPA: hypothetical protein VGZ47_14395 [Gemmataceae bacterium]|nr:hypothetical protein [Gemmataceae bacterium]